MKHWFFWLRVPDLCFCQVWSALSCLCTSLSLLFLSNGFKKLLIIVTHNYVLLDQYNSLFLTFPIEINCVILYYISTSMDTPRAFFPDPTTTGAQFHVYVKWAENKLQVSKQNVIFLVDYSVLLHLVAAYYIWSVFIFLKASCEIQQ